MLYLITGGDEFSREEFVATLKSKMRGLPAGEHNITELDANTSIGDLITACNITPFLCEKRLVIGRGIVGKNRAAAARAELADYLPRLPDSTHLVLIENQETTLAPFAKSRAEVYSKSFPARRERELPQWITERARKRGIRIAADAARALVDTIGEDTRALDQEVEKLAAYADPGGTITAAEVQLLVHGSAANVFAWHDAIAERRLGAALAGTRKQLEGSEPAEVLAQVAALVRRLLVVRELMDQGRSVAREAPEFGLSSSTFAQDKLRRQAGQLPPALLERWYRTLQEADLLTKSGQMEGDLAVELAVAQMLGAEPVAKGEFTDARIPVG